jgi:hypothetical protein
MEHKALEERLDAILDEMRAIHSAFAKTPGGEIDFDGHRRYHESMIAAATAQEAFWREMKLEVAKKGVWGLLVLIMGLIVVGISAKLGMYGK